MYGCLLFAFECIPLHHPLRRRCCRRYCSRWYCLISFVHTCRTHSVHTTQKSSSLIRPKISAFFLSSFVPVSFRPSLAEPCKFLTPTPLTMHQRLIAVYGQTSSIAMIVPYCLPCISSACRARASSWTCQNSEEYALGGELRLYNHLEWAKLRL